MGLTWCRERIEQAQNSKSPVDRILVCCSNAIKPKAPYSHSQGKVVNDFVYKGMRNKNLGISAPVPIHAVPPRTRGRIQKSSDWQTCTLSVPDGASEPPVPPPRKKRKRKLNSMEVLNSELPKLHSPTYVRYSENLLSRNLPDLDATDTNETDVLRPLEKSYHTTGCDRFGKSSGNRTRKIKTESHPNDVKERKVKNDNERRAEQKIKHVSTVSLPNYNELIKPTRKVSTDFSSTVENGDDKTGNQSAGLKHPRRNSSTISLPGEGSNSILSSLSEATIHRLEAYMKKCRSFGALKPQQLLEKLEEFHKTHRSASESSDSWSGLDDWDLGVIEWCDSEQQAPPLTPKSTIPSKQAKSPFCNQKQEEPAEKNQTETKKPREAPTPKFQESPTRKTPIFQRSESVINGVPIEWFLDPSLRPLAIMPPPETQKCTQTPPPSPNENEGDSRRTPEVQAEEHSSLLTILRKYKDYEIAEPEFKLDVNDIVNAEDEETFGNDMVFEEFDANVSLNPFIPFKDRSHSIAVEKPKVLSEEKFKKLRSPSIGFESSDHLLEQLQTNKEEIEKEILLKPNELIQGLRRESLCQSLPEDAFEAFVNKTKPSLKDSLNEFLGFQDENKQSDEKLSKASDEKPNLNEERKEEDEEKEMSPPPPLPVNPPPIVINPPSEEKISPVPHSLVNVNDKPNNSSVN